MKCPNCGIEVDDAAKICHGCGTSMASVEAETIIKEAVLAESVVEPEEVASMENASMEKTSEYKYTAPQNPNYTYQAPKVAPAPAPIPTPAPAPMQQAPVYNQQPMQAVPPVSVVQMQAPQINSVDDLPPRFKPIGAWGYFGYNILFAIPLVGFIFLVVFACGGTQNVNLRNYARSFFCCLIIAAIVSVIVIVGILCLGGSIAALNY